MPHLAELALSPEAAAILAPIVGDKEVGERGGDLWVKQGRIRMELEDIGEGLSGDYCEDDPDDVPVLRFYFSALDEEGTWISLDDTSCCTSIDARSEWEVQLACACKIFDAVYPRLEAGAGDMIDPGWGRRGAKECEDQSWVDSEGFEELKAAIAAGKLAQGTPEAQSSRSGPRL